MRVRPPGLSHSADLGVFVYRSLTLRSVSALLVRALLVLTLAAGSMSAMSFGQSPAEDDPPPAWLIWNVTRWMPLVERWAPDFPELEHALVLAVIAQESQGFPYAESDDGHSSVGLMQVIPRSWTGTREQLLDPAFNIFVGMRMLNATIRKAGNVRTALGAYNCGFVSLEADRCHAFGGYAYADRVLDHWLPVFRAELGIAPTTTPERVAPPKATLTHTPIFTATETAATPPTLTETPLPPSPTSTQTQPHKEVVNRSTTFVIAAILLALMAGVFATVRDWKRLGGKR